MSCGCCCGLRAPQDVYSGVVANNTDGALEVAAIYRKADKSTERVAVTIAAGASHEFAQRTYTEETCTMTYVISAIEVAGKPLAAAPFPGVTSPVKGYKWTLTGSAAAPAINCSL